MQEHLLPSGGLQFFMRIFLYTFRGFLENLTAVCLLEDYVVAVKWW